MALCNCKSCFKNKSKKSDDDNDDDSNNDDNDATTTTSTTTTTTTTNNNKRCVNQLWFSNLLHIICGKWLKTNNQRT